MSEVIKRRKAGRPPKISDSTWDQIKAAKIKGCSNKEICRDYNVSMPTLMRWLDQKLNRCEIEIGRANSAFEIVSALTEAAMGGKADAARILLARLGRGPKRG